MTPRVALLLSAIIMILGLTCMIMDLTSPWKYWGLIVAGVFYSTTILWKMFMAARAAQVVVMVWILPIILSSLKKHDAAVMSRDQYQDVLYFMSLTVLRSATRMYHESLLGYWALPVVFSVTPERLQLAIDTIDEVEKFISDEDEPEYIFTADETGEMLIAVNNAVTHFLLGAVAGVVKVPLFAR